MLQENNELAPRISVEAQYVKDLSFENPSAPSSLGKASQAGIDLALDLAVERLEEDNEVFEVALNISATAKAEDDTLFIVELSYAGIFTLTNIPAEERRMILAIHCPAILFPFARKIIADVTQDGGFQPLMIDPIDFNMLYHRKMMEEQNPGSA